MFRWCGDGDGVGAGCVGRRGAVVGVRAGGVVGAGGCVGGGVARYKPPCQICRVKRHP